MTGGPWLVVGATGLVGSNCVRALQERGIPVVGASRHPGPGDLAVDVTSKGSVARALGEIKPSVVIDAAGATDVDRCEVEPDWAHEVNAAGAATLSSLLDPSCVLVYLSTCSVFDGHAGPYDESAIPAPINVYGRTKREGEVRVSQHRAHLVIRTSVVYGRETADTGKNSLYQLAAALGAENEFRASSDEVGNPTYARDLAEVLVDLVLAGARGVFNVAGADLMTRADYARTAAEVLGLDPGLVRPVLSAETRRPARRPLRHGLVSALAEATIGRPTVGVREGVESARRELEW